MATILDSLREFAAPALVSALSRQTGEPESAISRGLSAAIPAIASTIACRADDIGFMTNVAELATRTAAAPHPLETLGSFISPLAGTDTTTTTGGWLSTLFGQNLPGITDRIARFAGIRESSAGALLRVGAPLVLGYIGRLMRTQNLSVTGLASLFREERSQLAAAMPAGFTMPTAVHEHMSVRSAVDETAFRGWATPLVALLAGLCLGGLIWWWAGARPTHVARVEIVEPAERAVGTSGHALGFVRTLPGNVKVTIPSVGSPEDRLSMYLATSRVGMTAVNFDRIGFDSDSAVLTTASSDQIGTIAAILRAYPRAHVTIAGHTDNVGTEEANLALSRARAKAVADRLTADGVATDRVHAEGYGSQKPIADNSSDAGRAQNRRVELQVNVR